MLGAVLDYIARTNLFNFIIFAGIIAFVIIRLDIIGSIDRGVEQVAESINDSEIAKTDSESNLQGMQEKVANLESEIEELVKQTEDNAKLVGEQIITTAHKTVENIQLNSEKLIETRISVVKNDIMKRASLASVEVARNHIINELTGNDDLHNKFIDESIEAINEVDL